MRGLFLCFAVGCLAFASGVPTNEVSEVHTKNFEFANKEGIFAQNPFAKDDMVYAVCEGDDADKKCKVYVESTNQDTTALSCDVNLKYTGRSDSKVALFNAGNSKAIIAVRDGETKVKLISVNLKNCQIKEASLDVPKKVTKNAEGPLKVIVVPHEKNYDVVYQNKQLCHDFLCKATFDYEGKVVKEASDFPVQDLDFSFHQIEAANNAYLVSEIHDESTNVYLVRDGDVKPNTLFSGARGAVGLSTEGNELSYCAHIDDEMKCKQFDAEGKSKKIEVEIPIDDSRVEVLDALNLGNGLLTLAVGRNPDNNGRFIFAAHFDEEGTIIKSFNVRLECDKQSVIFPQLYKNSKGQYCASSICLAPQDSKEKSADFSRSTRCFVKSVKTQLS